MMHALSALLVAFLAASAAAQSCTITDFSQVSSVVSSCTNIVVSNLEVPAGQALTMNLQEGSSVTFEGTVKFEYAEWDGPMVLITGNKVNVQGASGSVFDGQGQLYWDNNGGSGGVKKPVFMRVQGSGGSVFKNIHLLNCPVQCASVQHSDGITLTGWNIDVSAGHDLGGKNTDGFGIAWANNVVISDSVVKNQDDCIVVNQGTNMHFDKIHCEGSHGLSLSVGFSKTNVEENSVSNVTFSNCVVKNSDLAIHVKVHGDSGTGSIKDLTYRNIQFSGIAKYGINIQQDYPSGTLTTNIPITGLTLSGVTGTVKGSNSMGVYIMCGSGACSGWNWSGVTVTGGHHANTCNYSPNGFQC